MLYISGDLKVEWDYRILLIILGILIFALIRRFQNRDINDSESRNMPDDPVLDDLDEKFFNNAKGHDVIPFIRAYNAADVAVLRSLFDSNGIRSLVNFNRMSSLYPNLKIVGHTDSIIYIYSDQKETAREVAENYIKTIREFSRHNGKDVAGNIAEMAIGGVVVPSGENRILPEILE